MSMTAAFDGSAPLASDVILWRLRGLQAMATCRIEWFADGVILEFAKAERLLAREQWPDIKSAMRRASVIRDALMLLGWGDPERA
ncbi:MAG: hypothetical protein ACRD2X_22855 [Vicinamibacteraceae bacterium]